MIVSISMNAKSTSTNEYHSEAIQNEAIQNVHLQLQKLNTVSQIQFSHHHENVMTNCTCTMNKP
jgi:hypothetical protein